MGLDTTHDAWHGAYSAFMRFRAELVREAWGRDIRSLPGYHDSILSPDVATVDYTEAERSDALYPLIDHSDCEGELSVEVLLPLAARLEELAPRFRGIDGGGHLGGVEAKALQFAAGCRAAAAAGEPLEFR